MNILVTGAAGFIGFHLCDKILKNTNFNVYGVDNLDPYYSIKLKKNKNFRFKKFDLKKNQTYKYYNKKKFKFIFHFY